MRLGVEAAVVDGVLVAGDVEIDAGRVARVGVAGGRGSGIAVPGFVDLHVHGFGGIDFAGADLDGYRRAGEALLASGVTAFRPTFVRAPEAELLDAVRAVPQGDVGSRVLGCHLEGPFLSPARLGMHPAAARRDPDAALLERLIAAGPVAHVTLAPELPGALELIELLGDRGILAACGHTEATAEQAHAAFSAGATHVTHLFNAMRPFAHRDPGIGGAALVRDDVTVELILDGTTSPTRRHRSRCGPPPAGSSSSPTPWPPPGRATVAGRWGPSRSRCRAASCGRSTASSQAAS